MKALFIGGTGNISSAASRLAVSQGVDLYILNRGNQAVDIPGAKHLVADINDANTVAKVLQGHDWDVVANWVAFTPEDVIRDLNYFHEKTRQYIFISSASVYQKPLSHPIVTESTPLSNPFWEYSRQKIACEDYLVQQYRALGFPITIVRPSLTYEYVIPTAIGGWQDYGIVNRIKTGQPVIVHGDGTSIWTITHSTDFAKGFVGLMGHQQALGQAFHITSDELLTWDQIYQAVGMAVGKAPNIVHIPSDFIVKFNPHFRGSLLGDKAGSTIFDNSKIKQFVPGYQATTSFKTGIKRTIEWFEASPERMVVTKSINDFIDTVITAYQSAYNKDYAEVPYR